VTDQEQTAQPQSAAPADQPATAPAAEPVDQAPPKPDGFWWGTGRRKRSIARVRIKPGTGLFKINDRELDNYFRLEKDREHILQPLRVTDTSKRMDVFVNIYGGGTTGQAGAIVLGLARALMLANRAFEPALRDGRFLTRDARKVERKKYGRSGARRSFQFSKR